jgi:hypothetical protein
MWREDQEHRSSGFSPVAFAHGVPDFPAFKAADHVENGRNALNDRLYSGQVASAMSSFRSDPGPPSNWSKWAQVPKPRDKSVLPMVLMPCYFAAGITLRSTPLPNNDQSAQDPASCGKVSSGYTLLFRHDLFTFPGHSTHENQHSIKRIDASHGHSECPESQVPDQEKNPERKRSLE